MVNMTAFADLSPEGKRQKLAQHLETGHPVPASWVEWVLGETDRLQHLLDTRPAINAGLVENYTNWSRGIYTIESRGKQRTQ
jgi:hypothetical protein